MNLENVTRDDWIVGGLALLLAIGLLLFPWFDISVGPFSTTFTATGSPDGWLGILGFIAALAIVADLAIERLAPQTQIPSISGSRSNTRFILALVAAAFVALKFLFHIHFDFFGWGFYVNVIVTAALVWVALGVRSGAALAFPGGGAGGGASRTPSRPTPPPPPAGTTAGTPGAGPASPGAGTPPTDPPAGAGGSTPPPRP